MNYDESSLFFVLTGPGVKYVPSVMLNTQCLTIILTPYIDTSPLISTLGIF